MTNYVMKCDQPFAKSKVLIGIPCMSTIHTKTAFSLFNLKRPEGVEIELVMEINGEVARCRNLLAERAIKGGFTHLFFIDSDMKFNPDILEKMLAHDTDIVGVMYHQRRLPLCNNLMPLDVKEVKGQNKTVDFQVTDDVFEVNWVGTGIMLVKTDVFKKLEAPLFTFKHDPAEYMGEDVYFCRKAREAGYKIYVDADVAVRHVGEFEY